MSRRQSIPWSTLIKNGTSIVTATSLSFILPSCGKRAEVSYRITVSINDNGKSRSNSAVWRFAIRGGGFPNTYTTSLLGESIPIDMGSKGTLYVLTVGRTIEKGWPSTTSDIMSYGRDLFGEVARITRGEPVKGLNPLQEIDELRTMIGQTALLDCAHLPGYTLCPFMVRFRDERDPMTVEAVDPVNLAAIYGPGVSLLPIKIQLTDDDPTDQGISKHLKWTSRPQSMSLNGEMSQAGWTLPAMLKTIAFKSTGE